MKNLNQTLRTYIFGFISSIVLTLVAYILVLIHVNSYHVALPHIILIPLLLVIALVQLIVQLIFFLHLGKESSPRWNAVFFISTFGSILVIIAASIWIMNHLNYNMTPRQMDQYIQDQSSF